MTDTIFALSSGSLPAAIAVLRISGPAAFAAITAIAGDLPTPRRASLRTLRHGGEPLDRALVLIFPGPATATGEDLAELHLHGGRAVVRAVETALASMPGLRPALAGEFTRRALTHGRIDLTEAEGLADLLTAETESQRRVALRSAQGVIRRRIEDWSTTALQLSASVEALLDHGDEADVVAEADAIDAIGSRAHHLADAIDTILSAPTVDRLRDGIRVVLSGPPNAGKSTLLNALVQREAAIVSSTAGTTRDRIEAPVARAGVAWLFTDTAGLRAEPTDQVERIGIDRAREALNDADLILWLGDSSPPDQVADRLHLLLHPRGDEPGRSAATTGRIAISAETGEGIDELWANMESAVATLLPAADAVPFNRRQHELAAQAAMFLRSASSNADPLLLAEDLRAALRSFDAITGKADVEAMLDALFGRFCIGK